MDSRSYFTFICLFSSSIHLSLPCPALCKCYHRRTEVVCNSGPINEFPSQELYQNTTVLTIQFTNISSITEQDLNSTPMLQGLHLFSNQLKNLSPNLLRGVPKLTTLDLTDNQLDILPADVFSHAPLESLVLKNNRIENANAEWFSKNSMLTWLDLSGNLLTKIPTALLRKLPNLDNLDLPNNRLEKISANSFDALPRLERLNLHSNKLDTLDETIFQKTQNLTHVFLSRNKLQKLPKNVFQNLTQLRHLNLDENQLKTVPPGLFDPLVSLDEEGLDLTVNPWSCDGKIEYLWRWMQKNKKKVFLPDTVTCASPQPLIGRPVVSLTPSDLNIAS